MKGTTTAKLEGLEQKAKQLLSELEQTQRAILDARDAEELARSKEAQKQKEIEALRMEMGVPLFEEAVRAYRKTLAPHGKALSHLDAAIQEAVRAVAALKGIEIAMYARYHEVCRLFRAYDLGELPPDQAVNYPLPSPMILDIRTETKSIGDENGVREEVWHLLSQGQGPGDVISARMRHLREHHGLGGEPEEKGAWGGQFLEPKL